LPGTPLSIYALYQQKKRGNMPNVPGSGSRICPVILSPGLAAGALPIGGYYDPPYGAHDQWPKSQKKDGLKDGKQNEKLELHSLPGERPGELAGRY
jgi:hypothetical protein